MSGRARTGWIVLVVLGTVATVGSAGVGLWALTTYLYQADELDGQAPPPVLAPGEKGPLLRLAGGQSAQVHYESRGCFHSIDKVMTFARGDDGRMQVSVHGNTEPWEQKEIYERVLAEPEVVAIDRELLFAERARGDGCTNRDEYEVIIFEGARPLRHATFVNASCEGPTPAGALTFDKLAAESRPRTRPATQP